MEKEFVNYNQSLALKELGFDEPCWAWWHIEDCDTRFCYSEQRSPIINSRETEIVGLPTFSQAFRWFREKYGLSGLIEIGTQEFSYQVFNYTGNRQLVTEPLKYNGTYEEAEQTCLDKAIEIIKNKQD
jgi:hypothetical protein